jgi:hypothetical protein
MISQTIFGMWLFTSLIYQGSSMPLPNPNLKIYYEFLDTGINTLRYHREGEMGFCERRAAYEFSGHELAQQVIWVNPQNAPWCGQDTDMQLGNRSWSKAWLENRQFHLTIPMGEEEIIYVWDQVN